MLRRDVSRSRNDFALLPDPPGLAILTDMAKDSTPWTELNQLVAKARSDLADKPPHVLFAASARASQEAAESGRLLDSLAAQYLQYWAERQIEEQ